MTLGSVIVESVDLFSVESKFTIRLDHFICKKVPDIQQPMSTTLGGVQLSTNNPHDRGRIMDW